jgi:hypothetical protein
MGASPDCAGKDNQPEEKFHQGQLLNKAQLDFLLTLTLLLGSKLPLPLPQIGFAAFVPLR